MKQRYLTLLPFPARAASPGLAREQPCPSSRTLSSCAGDLALGGVAAVTRRSRKPRPLLGAGTSGTEGPGPNGWGEMRPLSGPEQM